MKAYLLSIAAGLLVGVVYSLLGVRSPAPPMIALAGLLGILLGEQIIPLASRLMTRNNVVEFVTTECRDHVMGKLPGHKPDRRRPCGQADA